MIFALILLSAVFIAGCDQSPEDGVEQTGLESNLGAIGANTSKGAKLTLKYCGTCHSLDRNIRKVGPTLKGIMGRSPSISDMPFDVWNEENMDRWLTSPRSVKQTTRMGIPGISDPAKRKAIIDYLKLI